MTTKTRELATFSAAVTTEGLPEAVVHNASRALVDWMAAALAGSTEPAALRVREVVAALGSGGPCAVIGTTLRTSPPFAALANAYASHLLDYDDVYNPSATTIHLGACVWPAVLAIAEARELDGRAATAAYIAGFEVGARVAVAAGPRHYESGWHVTGTAGHLAAAAAAANALGLSAERTVCAFGAAATQAAGIREVYGSDTKAIHPGKAAMDGVLSALLAENSFTSTDTALEGDRGLLRAISPSPDPAQLVEGLGTHWHVLDNGHKLYPSASLTHPAIDAAIAVEGLDDPADVRSVEVRMAPFAAQVTALRDPTTGAQARFSTAHCVAVAMIRRSARLAEFTDEVVRDPEVTALREKVRVISDDTIGKRACRLTVVRHDRTELRAAVDQNRGTPGNPLQDDDLEDKLVLASDAVLGHRATDLLIKMCWSLGDVSRLADLITLAIPES